MHRKKQWVIKLLSIIIVPCLFFACNKKKDPLSFEERNWLKSNEGTIVVAAEPDWPPVTFFEDDGTYKGIVVEYIRILEKKLGCSFKLKKAESWAQIIEQAKKFEIDVIMNIASTPERSKYLWFTKPYIDIPTTIVTRKDSLYPLTLSQMDGMEIVVTDEYQVIDYLKKNYPAIQPVKVKNSTNAIKRLSAGEFDAFITEVASASYIIEKEMITNLQIAGFTGHKYSLRIGTRNDKPILANILKKGLALITQKEREKIKRKWISLEQKKPAFEWDLPVKLGSTIFIILLSIIIISAIWKKQARYSIKTYKWQKAALLLLPLATILLLYGLFKTDYFYHDPLTNEERNWLTEQDGQIRFALSDGYPPFNFYDKNNKYTGLSADYIRLIEEKFHFRFKMVRLKNWEEVLKKAKSGDIDVVSSIQKNTLRSKFLLFTRPYVDIPSVIIARQELAQQLSLNKMQGMKVAVVKGSEVENYLKENYGYLELHSYPDPFSGLTSVSFKSMDAMVVDLPVASFYISKEGIANLKIAGSTGYMESFCFASRKDLPILNRILDKGLGMITREEKRTILARWFHLEQHPFYKTGIFWIITVVPIILMSGIIFIILAWNRSLRNQVSERTKELNEELEERKAIQRKLKETLDNVKTLEGLVPICAKCKKIRDDKGYWNNLEEYIQKHSYVSFSHGICTECSDELYGNENWYLKMKKKKKDKP